MEHELFVIEIILWLTVMILFGIFASKMYDKYKEEKSKFTLGIATFALLFLIHRFLSFFQIFVFNLPYQDVYVFMSFELVLQIGVIGLVYGGLLVLYLVLESYVIKTKYIFTILTAILISIVIINYFTPFETIYFQIPFFLPVVLGIPAIYFYLAIKSPGEVRKNSLILAFGMIIFILGISLAIPSLQAKIWSIFLIPCIYELLAPICQIIGTILIIRGFIESSV